MSTADLDMVTRMTRKFVKNHLVKEAPFGQHTIVILTEHPSFISDRSHCFYFMIYFTYSYMVESGELMIKIHRVQEITPSQYHLFIIQNPGSAGPLEEL